MEHEMDVPDQRRIKTMQKTENMPRGRLAAMMARSRRSSSPRTGSSVTIFSQSS